MNENNIPTIKEWQAEEQFMDELNDTFGDVVIAGHFFETGYALKDIDPDAYREEFLNWCDREIKEGRFTIEDW